jgi:hypothetical protein
VDCERIPSNEHEVDALLVETGNEVKEVRRQNVVVVAASVFAHRTDGFPVFWRLLLRRPADANTYACFDASATAESRSNLERPGAGTSSSS